MHCKRHSAVTFTAGAGSEADWVLDLVATGFSKPAHLFGHTLRTKADVDAVADAFRQHTSTKVGAA